MLRIDETSKTLVAPPAGGLVTEVNPDRDEMVALVTSSWEAFAGELGQPSLRFAAADPVPGLDVLAFDEQAGRAVVVQVAGDTGESQLTRALTAAGAVAALDAAGLAEIHDSLQAAVPGDSPQIVFVAATFDAGMLTTVDWLTRRHGLEVSCFAVSVFRFGAERLLSIRREYPARDVNAVDPAAEVQRMLAGEPVAAAAAPLANGSSTPPPALEASGRSISRALAAREP